MGLTIFRPGRRVVIPSPGVQVWTPSVASASTWWNNNGAISGCVAAYQPKGAASLAASYSNLANPGTYDAAPGVAPTWNATSGWIFNGSTQYLTTGIVNAGATWSYIVRFSDLSNNCSLFGCHSSPNYLFIYRSAGSGFQYGNMTTSAYVAPSTTFGVFAIANRTAYRNGAVDTTLSASSNVLSNQILIGCRGTPPTEFANGYIQAFAIYSVELTSDQINVITTALQIL